MDIVKASSKLSELDIKIDFDNFEIEVLWFRAMTNSGDWQIGRHTHSSYEFHFVSSGACGVRLDGSEFMARQGEFYLTAPGVYHEQYGLTIKDGEYTEYSINCDIREKYEKNTEAKRLLDIFNTTKCKAVGDKFSALRYFEEALEEAYYQRIGFYNNLKSLVAIIISAAARALDENVENKYSVPLKIKKNDYRFMQIEKYINDNISGTITTQSLANYMFLSNKQVCRIIRENTGKATKDYINSQRLQAAKRLIKESNLSIKEISDILGFSSEYYFSQFFKRCEGYPPGQYRLNVQAKQNVP